MADLVLVLTVLGFFGLCLLYIRGCDHMIRNDDLGDCPAEPVREAADR